MLKLLKRLRNEDGNVLVTVILVSMLVGALTSLTLVTGGQADRSSARDRNHEIALGVAEAGVHKAIGRIEQQMKTGYVSDIAAFIESTTEGKYRVDVDRVGDEFIIDAEGVVADAKSLERKRHIKITLSPPELFDDGYALFSATNLYLKNNNEVYDGDIWANDSLWVESGAIIEGSITSAQSWIKLESGAQVAGNVWSGGRKCETEQANTPPQPPTCISGWGINFTKGTITGWAKSSVSAPNCAGETPAAYNVILDNQDAKVLGSLTLLGSKQGAGTAGSIIQTCSGAPPAKTVPAFHFSKSNYDPATYHEYSSAAAFNSALTSTLNKNALEGTFVITECSGDRVNLQGAQLAGDVTIITNPGACPDGTVKGARILTDGVGDDALAAGEKAQLVLVSHYAAPAGAVCTDQNDTLCAVAAKNHFDPDCKISTLVYADQGPVAMKNDVGNEDMCGSVIAAGIVMKNGLQLTYDPIFTRVLGFGPETYEISKWEELPVA